MNISRAMGLLGIIGAVSMGTVLGAPQNERLDIAGVICLVLDDIGKTEKEKFPRNFEVKVDEKADLYVVHVVPLESVPNGMAVMGGGYEVVVDRKTRRISRRTMGQ